MSRPDVPRVTHALLFGYCDQAMAGSLRIALGHRALPADSVIFGSVKSRFLDPGRVGRSAHRRGP
jgi:hypothetical protein